MSKPNAQNPPTGAQLEILQVLQRASEPLSAAEVWTTISATREVARPTIATLLSRLEQSGWVTKNLDQKNPTYSANIKTSEAKSKIAENFLAKFFASSPSELVLSLFDQGKLTPQEIERLKKIVSEDFTSEESK